MTTSIASVCCEAARGIAALPRCSFARFATTHLPAINATTSDSAVSHQLKKPTIRNPLFHCILADSEEDVANVAPLE